MSTTVQILNGRLSFKSGVVLAAAAMICSVSGCGGQSESADVIFERGILAADRGEMESAVRFFSTALEKAEGRSDIAYERGRAYEALGFLEKAVADYDVCLKQEPDFEGAINNKGVCLAKMMEHERAIEQFSRLVELSPSNVLALRNRGLCYHDTQQFELAVADYNAALEIAPEDPETWFQRGNVLLEQNQPEEAFKNFSEAVRLDAAFSKAWMNRGVAQFALGHPTEGMEDLMKAQELDDSIIIPDLDWVKLSQTTELNLTPGDSSKHANSSVTDASSMNNVDWEKMKSDSVKILTARGYSQQKTQTAVPNQLCGIIQVQRAKQKFSVYVGVILPGKERIRIPAAPTAPGAKRSLLILKWDQTQSKFVEDQFIENWTPSAEDISAPTVEVKVAA